jgi:hypothetical protein
MGSLVLGGHVISLQDEKGSERSGRLSRQGIVQPPKTGIANVKKRFSKQCVGF